MKKFQTNQEKLIMVSTSALAGVMIVTNFIGCSRINPETSGESITNDPSNSNIESLKESTSLTNESSENIEMYSFTWSDALSDKFSNYCKKVFNINLVGYIRCFGLTDELNAEFTKFVNTHFGTKYDKVPFKKANYFYSYIYSEDGHYLFRDYTRFSKRFLNDKKLLHGTFNNKLILSYLIANKIELGKMIPIDNFKSMFGDKIYSGKEYFDFCINNPLLGNYESSHKYSEDEIHAILIYYNSNLSYLFNDERVKTRDFKDIPDPEAIEIYNQHLKKFYGENAPQIGQVPTKEQYRAIFGEDPLDLSYIPGAVMSTPQETMASPVSYIDWDNYNVYYNPSYNLTSQEEQSGRSR